jgi:hypothetical protein
MRQIRSIEVVTDSSRGWYRFSPGVARGGRGCHNLGSAAVPKGRYGKATENKGCTNCHNLYIGKLKILNIREYSKVMTRICARFTTFLCT